MIKYFIQVSLKVISSVIDVGYVLRDVTCGKGPLSFDESCNLGFLWLAVRCCFTHNATPFCLVSMSIVHLYSAETQSPWCAFYMCGLL